MIAKKKRLSLQKGKLYLAIAGPSGGGKSTLCEHLLDHYQNLQLSISSTTRPIRGEEEDGVHYFFVSKSEFQNLIDQDKLVEWAEVHGNFYGTSKAYLAKAVAEQKVTLLDVDIQGVHSFERLFPENTVSIFLHPPNLKVLEERLRRRGTESDDSIQKRLENAKLEIEKGEKFTHQITNADLNETFRKLCEIVESEFGVEE